MKKIETTKTEVRYRCDFCEFKSYHSSGIEEHEKQHHECKHENFYFRIVTNVDGFDEIIVYKKCKDCYLTLEEIEKDMDNFSDDDKQKIWDIFIKYKE